MVPCHESTCCRRCQRLRPPIGKWRCPTVSPYPERSLCPAKPGFSCWNLQAGTRVSTVWYDISDGISSRYERSYRRRSSRLGFESGRRWQQSRWLLSFPPLTQGRTPPQTRYNGMWLSRRLDLRSKMPASVGSSVILPTNTQCDERSSVPNRGRGRDGRAVG